MKYLIILTILASCSSAMNKPEFKHDADMICKLASLEFPKSLKKNSEKISDAEAMEIRVAMTKMLPDLLKCANQERMQQQTTSKIPLCYMVGTDSKGKITYSKYYSHEDRQLSKEFLKCLEKPEVQVKLSIMKSVKITQPVTL